MALSLIPEEIKTKITIFLITDDTLQAKFGDKFDCYTKLFDHTKHDGTSYLNGHCFVSLVISIPILFLGKIIYITLPIGYKLYDKSETKLEIASKMMIEEYLFKCSNRVSPSYFTRSGKMGFKETILFTKNVMNMNFGMGTGLVQ